MNQKQILQTYPLAKTEIAMPELIDELYNQSIIQFKNRHAFENTTIPSLLKIRSIDTEVSTLVFERNSFVIYDENFGLTICAIIKHILNPNLDKQSLTKEMYDYFGNQLYIKGNIPGSAFFTFQQNQIKKPKENIDEDLIESIIWSSILYAINHELAHIHINSLDKSELDELIKKNQNTLKIYLAQYENFAKENNFFNESVNENKLLIDDELSLIKGKFNDRVYNEEIMCNNVSFVHTLKILIDFFKVNINDAFQICLITLEATNILSSWKNKVFDIHRLINKFYYESPKNIKIIGIPEFPLGVEYDFDDFLILRSLEGHFSTGGFDSTQIFNLEKKLVENEFRAYKMKEAKVLSDIYRNIYKLFKKEHDESIFLSNDTFKLITLFLSKH